MLQRFELRTLGEFALSYAGESLPTPPTKKARALLAYLVMHRTADVSRESLLERFWSGFEPERARDNLKVSLWSVRRTIRAAASVDAGDVLRADRTVVRWLAPIDFDVDRFGVLCAASRHNGVPSEALSIYRGDFLEGDFDDWASAQRERLAAQYEALLSHAAAAAKDVTASQALLGRNPYDEAAYATLIEAELVASRPQAAAILVERYRSVLAEIGAEPSEHFQRRFGSLRRAEMPSRKFQLPFVARTAELGELGQRLTDATSGTGSVTIVHGDAGIGKSSVVAQAAHSAAELGLRTVELRCTGRETQTLDEWRALYETTTGRSLANAISTAGTSAGVAIARDLTATLRAGSSALLIDDAQHLSGESFTVLVELARLASDSACLVVASRPEGVARLRTALHDRSNFSEIRLDCLSRDDLGSALRQGSGSELPELAQAVFERTKGHPLYVVETLAALVENGTLARAEHGWTLRSEIEESLPVSANMRAFIEGRLTARGSVPASVASALALEPAATASELGRALAMDETTLLDALDDLLSLGLILSGEAVTPFVFSHDLVQEAAVAMLNPGRRVRIHAAFARDLQTSSDRNAALRRARHLLAADEPLPASADFLKAARGARKAGLAQDAVYRAQAGIAALEHVEDSPERDRRLAALQHELARANFALLELDAAARAIDAAATLARARGETDNLASALLLRAQIAAVVRTPVERSLLVREALDAARKSSDGKLLPQALVELAATARENGEREEALRAASEAFDAATSAERWDTAVQAGAELVLTHATWWGFTEALRWVSRSREVAARAGSAAEATQRAASALLWHLLDRYDEADHELALARRAVEGMQKSATTDEAGTLLTSQTFIRFLSATAAQTRGDGAGVLHALELNVIVGGADFPARADALTMIRIEGLLLRTGSGDAERARELCTALPAHTAMQSALGLSACAELSRATVAARCAEANAKQLLRRALDALEGHAHRTPLATDTAFARLQTAAREIGSDTIAVRAAERAAYFRSERRAAAGSGWGGRAN